MQLTLRPKQALLPILTIVLTTTLSLVLLVIPPVWAQSSVVIGTDTLSGSFPFGFASYQGEYQQVYTASALSGLGTGPITITSIAFKSESSGTIAQSFTYSLFYTSTTPDTISTDYAANKGASASLTYTGSPTFTAQNNGSFDFVLPAVFTYNPSQGNLLLDVNVTSGNGDLVGFAAGASSDTGRVFNSGGSGAPLTRASGSPDGLQTQFIAVPAPEPTSRNVFALAVLFLGGLMLRAQKRRICGHYLRTRAAHAHSAKG